MAGLTPRKGLTWITRLIAAATFLAAAFPKILDPLAFATSIDAYRIIDGASTNWVALLLPWLELFIAIGLLTPWLRTASASTIAILLVFFITLHAISWARGLDISCGCYGEGAGSGNYVLLIMRNCALLLAILYVLWDERRTTKTFKKTP